MSIYEAAKQALDALNGTEALLSKQWMEDSEPGSERRMTREMCERLGVKL